MVLVAGYESIFKHNPAWTHLKPPEECLKALFVTKDGRTMQQQIETLLQVG